MTRYPYQIYITHLMLNGDSNQDIIFHMRDLKYVPPLDQDLEELRALVCRKRVTKEVREQYGTKMFAEESAALEMAFWIVENHQVRACIERLLIDNVIGTYVANILSIKFNKAISIPAVDMFRSVFWDVCNCTPIDFSEYFSRSEKRKPEPPPDSVTLATRPMYSAWKNGVHPAEDELTVEAMVREIQVDSFMKFKEHSSKNEPQKANSCANMVLRTAATRKHLANGGGGPKIPDLAPMIFFPEDEVATLGEIHSEYSENVTGTGADSDSMKTE